MVTLLDYTDPGREEEQKPTKEPPPRLQSPSSILTYKQCPRKYFYRYIARLPSKKSIHLIRGSIAHQVLEDFYAKDLSGIPNETFPTNVKFILQDMFKREWTDHEKQLKELDLTAAELEAYYEETKVMIHNFFHYLIDQLENCKGMTYNEALEHVRPRTEIELKSPTHHVRGFADAVYEHDGKTYILDYKTSKRAEISKDYKLQLSIYGMIFEELNKLPDEVGIFFLKHGQELKIPLTEEMVEHAKSEVQEIHDNTRTRDIDAYQMKPSPLCKWSTGQCDFYELCFGNKKLTDFDVAADLVQIGK